MREIDLEGNPRIPELTRVMREVSSLTDPAEMLRAFGPWIGSRFRRDYFVSASRRGLKKGQYKITRALGGSIDPVEAQKRPAQNPWADWHKLPTYTTGIIGEIIASDRPRLIADLDLANDPVLSDVLGEDAARMKALAAMPAFDNGDALNWAISFTADDHWYGLEEFEAGFVDINMMGTATRNLVARRQVEELNERMMGQFEQIARIQRALLPEKHPRVPGYEIATSYFTSDEAGGDYYDFYEFPDGRLAVLIADVSGHGAGAATVMAMLRAIIHCYEDESNDVARFANYCNEKLSDGGIDGNFVTAFFCILEPNTGEIVWTRCGHNPPRIRRADGTIDVIESAGTLPLGIVPDIEAECDRGVLNPGDTLVLYTDGITEARSPGGELLGEKRMDDALCACSGEPECIVDSVHAALFKHVTTMTRDDDQTLVVVGRTGPKEENA